jgi:hypothetical protein
LHALIAGEAALVSALIDRYFDTPFDLGKPRNVVGLLIAASVATAISGIGGTAGFELFHYSSTPLVTIWHHWFASDALGIVTVAPPLIGLARPVRDPGNAAVVEGILRRSQLCGTMPSHNGHRAGLSQDGGPSAGLPYDDL